MSIFWICSYVHQGEIGVLLEMSTLTKQSHHKTDFLNLSNDIAMHIAASEPRNVSELLSQPFLKDPDSTVVERLNSLSTELKDSISISRFIRWNQGAGGISPNSGDDPAVAINL